MFQHFLYCFRKFLKKKFETFCEIFQFHLTSCVLWLNLINIIKFFFQTFHNFFSTFLFIFGDFWIALNRWQWINSKRFWGPNGAMFDIWKCLLIAELVHGLKLIKILIGQYITNISLLYWIHFQYSFFFQFGSSG